MFFNNIATLEPASVRLPETAITTPSIESEMLDDGINHRGIVHGLDLESKLKKSKIFLARNCDMKICAVNTEW